MAGHYSDNDDSHNEPVQDYLDLLLAHATEKPEAQMDAAPDEQDQHTSELVKSQELSSVNNIALFSARAGTRVAARSVAPSISPVAPPQDPPHSASPSAPQATRQSKPLRPTLKPFAEPVRPMPLKAPVMPSLKKAEPQTKTETPVPTRTQVQTSPKLEAAVKTRPDPVALEPTPTQPSPVTPAPVTPEPITKPIPPTEKRDEVVQAELPPEAIEVSQEKPFTTTEWLNGRPSWAQGRFECLLFSVGGLTLAVPLVELGTIYPMNEELTPIFGQADWFMGLLTVKDSNLKTIDTAKVVMPERYQSTMAEKYGFVISINGMSWGLAVDSVANAILLEPSDVKWRSERSKRPWLAGTVVEHMCALVDVSQLAAMFEAAGKRKQRQESQK